MQGDFPLYTKRKLEEIHTRWNAKRTAERQPKPVVQKPVQAVHTDIKPEEPLVKKEFQKPYSPNINTTPKHENNYSQKKDNEPAKPVNEDMLKMLADKFKKG